MESGSIVALATAVLTVVSVFLGVKYRQGLKKARLFAELLADVVAAAEDDKVTEEEFQNIIAAAKRVVEEVEEA